MDHSGMANDSDLLDELREIGMPLYKDAAIQWVKDLIKKCEWADKHGFHEDCMARLQRRIKDGG